MRDGIIPAEKINLPADIARFYAGQSGAWTVPLPRALRRRFPGGSTLLHTALPSRAGEHIFGDDDQAARVGIQPVDAAERADFALHTVISRDGVCKAYPSGARQTRHACRLVNHQKIRPRNRGNLLRKNGGAGSILLQMKTEKVAGVEAFHSYAPHAVQEGAVVCFL